MTIQVIEADDVTVGKDVSVCRHDGSGQGGVVTRIDDAGIAILAPGNRPFEWTWDEVGYLTHDAPLPADECLDYDPDECSGPVDLHTTGNSHKAWPRCNKHQAQRQARYDDPNSSERWASSDVPPPSFHSSWGGANEYGEHWSESDY